MATDLMLVVENRVGMLAELGNALGEAGVNLAGACALTAGGEGTLHLLVDEDPGRAKDALSGAGIDVVDEREVLVVDVTDQPGQLGVWAQRIADTGANIELMYVATGPRLVFGVDDPETARAALG